MIRIRDSARFTRVTLMMLRHYNELGLLKPSPVERSTVTQAFGDRTPLNFGIGSRRIAPPGFRAERFLLAHIGTAKPEDGTASHP